MAFRDTRLWSHIQQLHHKGLGYWCVVGLLIAGGISTSHFLEEKQSWLHLRYRIYQYLQRSSELVRPVLSKWTVPVLIDDEAYWKSELAGRAPINREYLAKLIRALDKGDPKVIAVDFDLRSPVVDGSLIDHPEYQDETAELIRAVQDVSQRRAVVLPKTLGWNENREYVLESSVFDGANFNDNVYLGYIDLPTDIRKVPSKLTLTDGTETTPFSSAIAQVVDADAVWYAEKKGTFPYGSFMPPDGFRKKLHATDALKASPDTLKADIDGNIVIIGSDRHSLAFKRGPLADGHPSPVGVIGGVYVHANYVEALIDGRIFKTWDKNVVVWLEILLAIIIAIAFALEAGPIRKLFVITLVTTWTRLTYNR